MMGRKKLSTIRRELRAAFGKTGEDPIQWLAQRIRQLENEPEPARDDIEALQALLRELENAVRSKPRSARARTKS